MRCRFHLIVLTAALLATAACGREPQSGAPPEQAGEISQGKATGEITVWAMGGEGENLGKLAAGFERENPEAKVKVTPVPWDGAHNKIANAIAAGQTPDISLIGTTWMGEFAKTGALRTTPSAFDRNAFFPGLWSTTEIGGKSYGVPWYADTRAFFYRKDMAERANVKPPTTWDELKSFTQALQEKGGAQHGIYLQAVGTGGWQTFMPFGWQAGGNLVDDTGKFTLDTPQMRRALEYYTSFHKAGLSANDRALPGQIEADFVSGKIGSFISGSYHRSLLTKQGGAEFESKYDVVELPKGDSAAGFAGGGNLVVFKGAKNADGAWKFVQYLSRPQVQAEWFAIQADPPAVQAAWQDPKLSGDEKLQVFARQLKVAKAPPAIPTWEQVAAAIDGGLEQAAKGSPAADVLKTMQATATSIGTGN
ncbi:multiple sugar transport system substrate-binding protein [Kibdelosporangium banguiense]|uniref:Multiple sugar transport system substrate-binding protein n=1 Tax=Kibdelosporangium banguiense TaxID=1365924 RepID=A0ABS4TPN3_9PSEU|nr:sugar ABC transporter substrate-binding protein [Kibdelosporangium banguiense]MBP2326358.1 multiple sugar transport system substrate-binding protein [Kibdelosporangium banguiense]